MDNVNIDQGLALLDILGTPARRSRRRRNLPPQAPSTPQLHPSSSNHNDRNSVNSNVDELPFLLDLEEANSTIKSPTSPIQYANTITTNSSNTITPMIAGASSLPTADNNRYSLYYQQNFSVPSRPLLSSSYDTAARAHRSNVFVKTTSLLLPEQQKPFKCPPRLPAPDQQPPAFNRHRSKSDASNSNDCLFELSKRIPQRLVSQLCSFRPRDPNGAVEWLNGLEQQIRRNDDAVTRGLKVMIPERGAEVWLSCLAQYYGLELSNTSNVGGSVELTITAANNNNSRRRNSISNLLFVDLLRGALPQMNRF